MKAKLSGTYLVTKSSTYENKTYRKIMLIDKDYEIIEMQVPETLEINLKPETEVEVTFNIISTKYGLKISVISLKTIV